MTFKPLILKYEKNKEFRWIGKLLFKGIFDGEHYFKIVGNSNGTTTFIHGEKFSGLLVSLFSKTLDKTKSGFELMNESLKRESLHNLKGSFYALLSGLHMKSFGYFFITATK